MFVILLFLVIGMVLTWLGVIIYAVVNANAGVKRKREYDKDLDRCIKEMSENPPPWYKDNTPQWWYDKYGI